MLIRMVFVITWEIFHGRISLNSVFLLLLANFLGGFRLKLMYISLNVSTTSSPTHFSAACAAATVHRNYFFCLYQQNKSYESKWKFRQANSCCKRVFAAAKLAYATKTTESITSQKLGSRDVFQITNNVLTKGKSTIPPLFSSRRCYPLHLRKQNCLLKTF